jgi:homocysteine S-methyltransferase
MLADGSEYRGRYGLSVAELERFHRPRLEVLDAARPDVLALETVPDADEARALLRALRGLRTPAWLSYSVEGARTRAGQPLEEAFALAADTDEVVAVGVNCCAPEDVDAAVRTAVRVTGKPVVVYPNSGEGWDAESRSWDGRSTFAADRVLAWRDAGARLIGGCCRVGPASVEAIARTLAKG